MPAKAGHDVQLTIDLDIQRAAEQALAEGLTSARLQRDITDKTRFKTLNANAGSVVVIDVTDGSVVALASNPTFDPNEFIDGIPTATWQALNDPANHYPLLNRVVSGQYAPGSTFKLVTGTAALSNRLITGNDTIYDKGYYEIGNPPERLRNAGEQVNGLVNVTSAMAVNSP
mgnify:CR=1 FL=1